jgi:hypothetical protein
MKIIILDFLTGEVHVYPYDASVWEDCEDFIESEEVGLNVSTCQWITVDELKIQIH